MKHDLKLPALPEPTWGMPDKMARQWDLPGAWSAVQMTEYGEACRAEAITALIQAGKAEIVARRVLCCHLAGAGAYMDDGEASDATSWPHIDFLRDPITVIQSKLAQRAITKPPIQNL